MDYKTTLAKKPFGRWSAETERSFLLALRYTGQVAKALAEIGRGKSAAYKRRLRDPEFADAWDEAVRAAQAEWAALAVERAGPVDDGAGGGRWTPGHDRIDGWDKKRRGDFLRVLARTKSVREACRAARMSAASAYALRGRSSPFARAWEKMLALDTPSVLDAALERAINGWVEPIVAGGKVVGERRRYSDALLRTLLLRDAQVERLAARREAGAVAAKLPRSKKGLEERAREAAKAAGGYFSIRNASEEETNAALMKKLDAVDRRMAREREEAEAEAAAKARRIGDSAGKRALPAPESGPDSEPGPRVR